MSETNAPRPWHGSNDPFGALHDWAMKELGALRDEIAKLKAAPAPVAVTPPAAPIVHPSPPPSPTPPDSNPSAPA